MGVGWGWGGGYECTAVLTNRDILGHFSAPTCSIHSFEGPAIHLTVDILCSNNLPGLMLTNEKYFKTESPVTGYTVKQSWTRDNVSASRQRKRFKNKKKN